MSPDHDVGGTGGREPGIYIECRPSGHGLAIALPWATAVRFCPACGAGIGPRALERALREADQQPKPEAD